MYRLDIRACAVARLASKICDLDKHGIYSRRLTGYNSQCDGRNPCGPCAVKNRVCRPYSRDLVFVANATSAMTALHSDRSERASKQKLAWQPPAILYGGSSTANLYCDQLLESFIQSYMSSFRSQEDVNDPWSFTWITYLPSVRGKGTAIDAGILSLASAGVGRQWQDRRLLKGSTDKYCAALVALQGSISRKTPVLEDETILAAMTLILYQLMREQEERKDWMTHAQGLSSIINSRRPDTFVEGISHNIFLASRTYISLAALYRCKSTFLAEDIWLTEPWKSKPKSDYQRMVDCMILLANVRARYSQLRDVVDLAGRHQELLHILECCRDLDKRFRHWYVSLPRETGPSAVVETKIWPPLDHESAAANPFPQSFEFNSLKTANMLMTYWSCLIILLTIVRTSRSSLADLDVPFLPQMDDSYGDDLHQAHERTYTQYSSHANPVPPQNPPQEFPESSGNLDPLQLATRICMSIQYCLKQETRPFGPYSTLFPLVMALGCFKAHTHHSQAQSEWCYGVMALIEDQGPWFSRILVGKYLRENIHRSEVYYCIACPWTDNLMIPRSNSQFLLLDASFNRVWRDYWLSLIDFKHDRSSGSIFEEQRSRFMVTFTAKPMRDTHVTRRRCL
nr:uncharacterized protein CFP56_03012 [Quercus suber]